MEKTITEAENLKTKVKKSRASFEKSEPRCKSESISRKLTAKLEKERAAEEKTRTAAEKSRVKMKRPEQGRAGKVDYQGENNESINGKVESQ